MIRSKASAALMRLKEIDKKYRVRCEDAKQEESSSDNTESLLRKPAEGKISPPGASEAEERAILKPTLSIKIPETFTEQLDSQSSSNKVSHSVRVSIVEKTSIVHPKVVSQSVSEIEEELEDAESISELLDESENSDLEIVRNRPEDEIEKSKTKDDSPAESGKNVSMEKKQSENFGAVLSDDYSHCSFESYSSVYESQSASEFDAQEANNSISVINANSNDARFSSKGIFYRKTVAEGTEKKNEEITANFAESIKNDVETETPEEVDEISEIIEELSKSVEPTHSFSTISEDSENIADTNEKLNSRRSKRKNLRMRKEENQEKALKNSNSSNSKLPEDKNKQKDLEAKNKQESAAESSNFLKSPSSSLQKSEENPSKGKVSKINDEMENDKEFSSSKSKISSRENSEQKKDEFEDPENSSPRNSRKLSTSLSDTNSSIAKSSRDRSRVPEFELADKTEAEEKSAAAKEDFPHEKPDDNEASLSSRANRTNSPSSQLFKAKGKAKKSSDCSENFGKSPTADEKLSECRSRGKSSERKSAHRYLASKRRDAEKGISKMVQKSQSAVEIGETRERKNSANIRKKKLHRSSKVHGYVEEKNRATKTSKSSACCRVNEAGNSGKDVELERFNMRLMDLRLEQERQMMLCYMRNFQEDRERLSFYPNRFYCPGKVEAAIIKPLKFQSVLEFVKPDSNSAKIGLTFPENYSEMLKDRVIEIRQWLKDQLILYQNYSDVAAAINAKYVAESEKVNN